MRREGCQKSGRESGRKTVEGTTICLLSNQGGGVGSEKSWKFFRIEREKESTHPLRQRTRKRAELGGKKKGKNPMQHAEGKRGTQLREK